MNLDVRTADSYRLRELPFQVQVIVQIEAVVPSFGRVRIANIERLWCSIQPKQVALDIILQISQALASSDNSDYKRRNAASQSPFLIRTACWLNSSVIVALASSVNDGVGVGSAESTGKGVGVTTLPTVPQATQTTVAATVTIAIVDFLSRVISPPIRQIRPVLRQFHVLQKARCSMPNAGPS